jgi:quercetin dioxygenase-like cupin family protein
MKVQPKAPSVKNPATNFTGDVWLDMIASPQAEGQRMSVAKVRFTPGARTNWHSHALGQTLHVTQGVGLAQNRGGEIIEIRPGDTIYTPPGEEHWHGATPEDYLEHLAMWDNGDDPATSTVWLEPVTDEEYHRP